MKQAGINALEDVVGNCDVGGIAFDEVDHGRRVQEQAGDALKGDADFHLVALTRESRRSSSSRRVRVTQACASSPKSG